MNWCHERDFILDHALRLRKVFARCTDYMMKLTIALN